MTAATRFGALDLPTPAPADGETGGDPAIDILLAFARDVMVAQLTQVHAKVAPNTGPVVRHVFPYNPAEGPFEVKQLAALYAWRSSDESLRLADDIDLTTSTLSLLWVFVPAKEDNQKRRWPIVNAVAKVLVSALLRGRHPAWTKANDPEEQASYNGSFLWAWMGLWSLDKVSAKATCLDVQIDEETARFPALQIDIVVTERAVLADPDSPAQLTGHVAVPDGEGWHTTTDFRFPKD